MKEDLNMCLVQTHLYWEDRINNIEHFTNIIAQVRKGTDIVVLPETFTTGFSMKKEIAESGTETVEWMKAMSAKHGVTLAGSFFVNEEGKCYNRLHFVEPDGEITIYNKKHLFRLTNEQEVFSAGEEQVIVDFKGWKISLMVCYDLRFPVWMRRSNVHDYDMLLLVANWPERRSHAWKSLLTARAIENQCYMVAVNRIGKDGNNFLYGGDSAVIDPMGLHIATGKPFTDELIYSTIHYPKLGSIRKALPFYEDRDEFKI